MAYVSQDLKARLAPKIKAILKRYGVKASLAVRHHSTLVLNVKSGKIDFIGNYIKTDAEKPYNGVPMSADQVSYIQTKQCLDVNTHWFQEHYSGTAQKFLDEMISAMRGPEFFDHTDTQTDYFHCSHYIDISIGQWNKPYTLEK